MERGNKLKEKRQCKDKEFKVRHDTRQKIQGYTSINRKNQLTIKLANTKILQTPGADK